MRLICVLMPGRAWFRALLMEGLIVYQPPGYQIRHVGSQPEFSSLPFMFAQPFFFPQSLQNWIGMLPLKTSPACHTSVIGPQCANCWHLRTEDWCVEGTVGITLLSTLHVMVCICNGVLSGMAQLYQLMQCVPFSPCRSNKSFANAKYVTGFCQ